MDFDRVVKNYGMILKAESVVSASNILAYGNVKASNGRTNSQSHCVDILRKEFKPMFNNYAFPKEWLIVHDTTYTEMKIRSIIPEGEV